jgi:hypothetical protein
MADPRMRGGLWAAALIVSGILLLLFNLGVLAPYAPWPQVVLICAAVAGAVVLFATFTRHAAEWWRLIPAWTLLALGGIGALTLVPGSERLMAALVFLGLACGFAHSYLLDRAERWWAVIPGGFMLALGGVLALSAVIEEMDRLTAFLFFALGAVFFLVYWLDPRRRQWWALIPGSVLVVFGALVLTPGQENELPLLRWWPLLLIAAGALTAYRSLRRPRPERLELHAAPNTMTSRKQTGSPAASPASRPRLGDYTQPAPGATVEVLPDIEE